MEHSSDDDGAALAGIDGGAGYLAWVLFNAMIAFFLYLDMKQSMSNAGCDIRRATAWSILWITLALIFALLLWATRGGADAATFLVGYLVEKSLSVDNLIVILLIFKHFRIKPGRQPRVLKWGIIGAIFMRAAFIFAGVELLERFEWMCAVFGLLLIFASYKMLRGDDDEEDDDLSQSGVLVKILQFIVPYSVDATTTNFFVRSHHSRRLVATPMFAALLVIETCDVVFAIDSIPCILGITHDRFLVYSSNMLAILGLRSLFVLLADALHRMRHLQTGLGLVLGFVGLKMTLAEFFPVSQFVSLACIAVILGLTIFFGGIANPSSPTDARSEVSTVNSV